MSKIVVAEIKDNYPIYVDLVTLKKFLLQDNISLEKAKKNNANFLCVDDILVRHSTLSNEITFIAEVRISNYKYFLFKLRCKSFCEIPFFRYDSDGGTHRNYDESFPLGYQSIKTPHFNKFDKNGLSIAYRTDILEDEEKSKALQDIEICISYFCQESNLRVPEDEFPTIRVLPTNLQLTIIKDDPNSGVEFI
jgi:hypothetical protein